MKAPEALERLGGVATRAELLALGCNEWLIDLSLYYGRIRRVRVGQYALLDTPAPILRALSIGGRLACKSALAFHTGGEVEMPLHVLVPYGRSRLGPRSHDMIVHWTRRRVAGTRLVVSHETAERQAASCRARKDA